MTPKQRDELAVMAGAEINKNSISAYYRWPDGSICGEQWLPETSLDDCQPLREEIERRGLWKEFAGNLCRAGWNWLGEASVLRCILYKVTPADIVAAFIKTIEEADERALADGRRIEMYPDPKTWEAHRKKHRYPEACLKRDGVVGEEADEKEKDNDS